MRDQVAVVDLFDTMAAANGAGLAAPQIGVDLATELAARLIEEGAPGLHFYPLNRSWAVRQIVKNLGLREAR